MQSSFASAQQPLLLIDESLSDRAVAQALCLVDYNAQAVRDVLSPGVDDPSLIRWLGLQAGVWVTADDKAKKQHADAMNKAGIHVLWIRRPKSGLSKKGQLLLLLWVLDEILDQLSTAKGPRWFTAQFSGKRPKWYRIQ